MNFNVTNAVMRSNSLFFLLTRKRISPVLLAAKRMYAGSFRPFPAGHQHPERGSERPHAQRLQGDFLEPKAQQPCAVLRGFGAISTV